MRGPLRALGSRLRGLKLFNRRWIIDLDERAHHDAVVSERIVERIPPAEADPALEPAANEDHPET